MYDMHAGHEDDAQFTEMQKTALGLLHHTMFPHPTRLRFLFPTENAKQHHTCEKPGTCLNVVIEKSYYGAAEIVCNYKCPSPATRI